MVTKNFLDNLNKKNLKKTQKKIKKKYLCTPKYIYTYIYIKKPKKMKQNKTI